MWIVALLFITLITVIVVSPQDEAKGMCLWKMVLLWKLLETFSEYNTIEPAKSQEEQL